MAINNVAITGRMTKKPEVKQTQSGVSVCNFCIAVDRPFKSGEDRQADFIDCVAWRASADFIGKYFDKGDMIGIIGRLQTHNWEQDDGQKRKTTEIAVEHVSFVGGKKTDSNENVAEKPTESAEMPVIAEDDEYLPF